MTAPVDVLAVMDAVIAFEERDGYSHCADVREARSAVAELIAAGKAFDALYQPDGPISHWDREGDDRAIFGVNKATITLGDMRKLRAALARVGAQP